MALDPVVNFFQSEIATLPVASGGTVIVLSSGDGAKLPNPAVDGAFNLTIYEDGNPFSSPEIVRVTGRSSDTLTVTRAQEGTTATTKIAGTTWKVVMFPTAKTIQDIDSKKVEKTGDTMTGTLTATKLIPSGNVTAGNGMYLPAANTVAVSTNGVERYRVTSTGDVGIGITNPTAKFTVSGNTDLGAQVNGTNLTRISGLGINLGGTLFGTYGSLILHSNANFTGSARRFMLTNALDGTKFAIIRSTNATTDPSIGSSGVVSSGTADFVINESGNVGIGTTAPLDKVHYSGSSVVALRVTATDAGVDAKNWAWQSGSAVGDGVYRLRALNDANTNGINAIRFARTGISSVITSFDAGNVGIGTTAPATKLDVVGSIRASVGILFGTDTSSANTLDDYEEGDWTPVYQTTGGDISVTGYGYDSRRYVKIGNFVHVYARFFTTGISSVGTGTVRIGGLPFTVNNLQSIEVPVNIGASFRFVASPISARTQNNTTQITLLKTAYTNAGDPVLLAAADLDTGTPKNIINIYAFYKVA
jgi:hypothetical protein